MTGGTIKLKRTRCDAPSLYDTTFERGSYYFCVKIVRAAVLNKSAYRVKIRYNHDNFNRSLGRGRERKGGSCGAMHRISFKISRRSTRPTRPVIRSPVLDDNNFIFVNMLSYRFSSNAEIYLFSECA